MKLMLEVGDEFSVAWSNGAGYSIFKIKDSRDEKIPYVFEVVDEVEVNSK
jgi:hypothetical protein